MQEIEQLKKTCDFIYVDEEKCTIDISSDLLLLSGQVQPQKTIQKPDHLINIQIKHKPHEVKFEKEYYSDPKMLDLSQFKEDDDKCIMKSKKWLSLTTTQLIFGTMFYKNFMFKKL